VRANVARELLLRECCSRSVCEEMWKESSAAGVSASDDQDTGYENENEDKQAYSLASSAQSTQDLWWWPSKLLVVR